MIALLSFAAGGVLAALIVAAILQPRLRQAAARAEKAEGESRQSRRLAEVGTLTGVLAHEIKNPLSTVGLNLQLLQEDIPASDPNSQRLRARLSTVQRETTRLREILDDFLRYAGKLELEARPTDLNRLVEELVDFFTPQAQLQHVQLRFQPAPGPALANVDPKALKQALLNLMINATQAMSQGGELLLALSLPDPSYANIDITDTGPGIPPEALDKIFQAYYSTKRGGSGLGLAMARRIADEHGGSLSVRSQLGKGSQFSLRLPTRMAPDQGA